MQLHCKSFVTHIILKSCSTVTEKIFFCADPASWIKTFVSIYATCQAIFLILTQLWSSKIVFQFCKMNYRALVWPCGDRRALLTEKISLILQSGSKEESLLLLTLLPISAGFPKGFVLYLEGNQTWIELENSLLWNLTHQICQLMFSEVNLGGQQQHKKLSYSLHWRPQKGPADAKGALPRASPTLRSYHQQPQGSAAGGLLQRWNMRVTCRAYKVVFAGEQTRASI